MNLNQFNYLLTIHKCGSITKAAQKLFVSAPSISNAIRHLEDELNCILLLRHHQGVSFTEQGEEAIRIISNIEKELEQLKQLSSYQDATLSGTIKLGSTLQINHSLILPTMLRIKETYPQIKIIPSGSDSQTILRMVAQNSLDLGVILFTNADDSLFLREFKRNNLQFSELIHDEMCFVVRKEHPLASSGTATLKDILNYPYYTYCNAFNPKMEEMLLTCNPNLEVIQLDDRELLRNMLLYSDASTTMPLSSKPGTLKHFPGLTFLHLADFSYRCRIGWIHKQDSLSRIEKVVIAALQEESASLEI